MCYIVACFIHASNKCQMAILHQLLNVIEEHQGAEIRDFFWLKWQSSQYFEFLFKPFLSSVGSERWQCLEHPSELKWVSNLRIINESSDQAIAVIYLDQIRSSTDVLTLFNEFCDLTSHSNSLGDFRKESQYYCKTLASSKYFFHHGDGNCVLLGVLFSSYVNQSFRNSPIELFYSCGTMREFMHVYSLYRHNGKVTYFDPDQKILCQEQHINHTYSPGLIFQMLSGAGYNLYKKLINEQKVKWFYSMTRRNFQIYEIEPQPFIYQSSPHRHDYSAIFQSARLNKEALLLDSHDYSWKQVYQQKFHSNEFYENYFLDNLSENLEIELDPGCSLKIGNSNDLPSLTKLYSQIFFGRIPLSITYKIEANYPKIIELLDLPWLIFIKKSDINLRINGCYPLLDYDNCSKTYFVGMGTLENLLDMDKTKQQIMIQTDVAIELTIIFPFNGFLLNSGKMRILPSSSLNISAIYGENYQNEKHFKKNVTSNI